MLLFQLKKKKKKEERIYTLHNLHSSEQLSWLYLTVHKCGAALLVVHQHLWGRGACRSPGSPLPGGALRPEIQERAASYLGCSGGREPLQACGRMSASEKPPVAEHAHHGLQAYVEWKKCYVPRTSRKNKKALNRSATLMNTPHLCSRNSSQSLSRGSSALSPQHAATTLPPTSDGDSWLIID